MDRQILAQFAQTVLIANSTAVNNAGEPTYGASTSAAARVRHQNSFLRNSKGEMVASNSQIVLSASADVRINSRIYLPGETSSANEGWVPVMLALRVGEAGSSDHWKVWL